MSAIRQPIFDTQHRDSPLPARHGESTFAFLNRASADYWGYCRELLQTWAEHIPGDADYKELRERFRGRVDSEFQSAFLELYLHESLIRAGYTVTIHPEIAGISKHPDFRAVRGGEVLYVEAIAPATSPAARAAANRRNTLFDTINSLVDTNFWLAIDGLQEADTPPAGADLRRELGRWLATLNPAHHLDLSQAPTTRWERDGWVVEVRALAKSESARGKVGDRAIGIYAHQGAEFIDDAPAIRKALEVKDARYGDLDAPYVIAVGVNIHDTDHHQSENAFYGDLGIRHWEDPSGEVQVREIREGNGYFGVPPSWRRQQVSAVLLVNQLQPYFVLTTTPTLWLHPSPLYPLPGDWTMPADQVTFGGDYLDRAPNTVSQPSFFGLSEPWPPGQPFPAA